MGSRGTACQKLCTGKDYACCELEEKDDNDYDYVRLDPVFHGGGSLDTTTRAANCLGVTRHIFRFTCTPLLGPMIVADMQ